MHCCMMYSSHSYLLLLTNVEDTREANLRCLGSFTKAITETRECAVGERA
jgi:hypothetical protein